MIPWREYPYSEPITGGKQETMKHVHTISRTPRPAEDAEISQILAFIIGILTAVMTFYLAKEGGATA